MLPGFSVIFLKVVAAVIVWGRRNLAQCVRVELSRDCEEPVLCIMSSSRRSSGRVQPAEQMELLQLVRPVK